MGVGYIFSFQLCHLVVGECLARWTSFEGWWFQAWFLPLCCFLGQTLFYIVSLHPAEEMRATDDILRG